MPDQTLKQLNSLIDGNSIIEYTGMQKQLRPGEVADPSSIAIQCHTISINGKQYLVKE
jgi:hypothetical protein